MLFGIILSAASLYGIINGIRKKNKLMAGGSFVLLILVIAVWVYFYNNPY